VLLVLFAEPLIVNLFSIEYKPAVLVFQLYALVIVRECIDFGVLVRAFDRNDLLLSSNAASAVVNIVLLFALMPAFGLPGAAAALAIARLCDGIYLLWRVSRDRKLAIRRLLPWGRLGRVFGAALLAALVLLGGWWTGPAWSMGGSTVGALLGLACATTVYGLLYVALLFAGQVPEARYMIDRVRTRAWLRKSAI
jgi:O-antigen/teichoic acid export membrane protein